jgi:hypothetical protein
MLAFAEYPRSNTSGTLLVLYKMHLYPCDLDSLWHTLSVSFLCKIKSYHT